MLQTYMFGIPESAKRISDAIAMINDGEEVVFFNAAGPFLSYKKNDKMGKRLAQGIIVNLGLANSNQLARAMGINQSTVYRNAETYRKKGTAGFVDDRSKRTLYKLTKEKLQIVKRLLDKGVTIVDAAKEVGVSEGCIRYALRKGVIEKKTKQPKTSIQTEKPKGPSQRSLEDISAPAGMAVKRETERVMASKGVMETAEPEFSANEGVSYAGVLLALPFLASMNYLETGKKIYGTLKNGYYGLQSIFLTLAFMALLRFKTPEQLKRANPGDFGILLGLDRCPEVKTLRRKLDELGLQNQSGTLADSMSRIWVEQNKDLIGFCYIDGHVRPYHGRKHTLPKTHVPRRRLCMPATTDFWINDATCGPVFCVTTEANDSLLSTVDKEVIPELKQLANPERVTIVFDREGWSPKQFSKWFDDGVDVITYRKGKYEPWSKDCFVEVTSEVRGKSVSYLLGQRSIKLGKNGWFREVRRLCDNGHQTSVITTRQDLSMEEVARRMFLRWNQENYFKYMREEYGLDHLVSRDVEQADIERKVPNPAKKELKKKRSKKQLELKKEKNDYATKVVENDETRCRTVRGFNISNPGMKSKIKKIEQEIENLDLQIKALPDKVAIKEILDESKIVKLETEKKRFTDIVKMVCYRTETAMLNCIDQSKEFPWLVDDGRSFMKSLFHQPADILPDYDKKLLEIRFHTMSTWHENKALSQICNMANQRKEYYPGTNLRLVFVAPDHASENS